MRCSSDVLVSGVPAVSWSHGSTKANAPFTPCEVAAAYSSIYDIGVDAFNSCAIIAYGNATAGNQGPYICVDDASQSADAVAILIGKIIVSSEYKAAKFKRLRIEINPRANVDDLMYVCPMKNASGEFRCGGFYFFF